MTQRRDHFLPAAYIGGFSSDTSFKSRYRPVWVNDRHTGTSEQRADDVAYVTGLYDLPDPNPAWLGDTIDLWAYEDKLPTALRQLETSRVIDARLWIDNLVPFVAGLFSRGPDANSGQNREARVMQFQEHLAPVMAAEWTVLHFPNPDLPTSDRALAPVTISIGNGYVVPLTNNSALLLAYRTAGQVAFWKKGRWYVRIPHAYATAADRRAVVDALAAFALSAVYGPTQESVAHIARKDIGAHNRVWPGHIVNDKVCDLICHVYDYFRVSAALQVAPDRAQAAADRADIAALTKRWRLPVALVLTHSERTRGCVYAENDMLGLDMRLGVEIKRLRRQLGDSVRGSFIVLPFEALSYAGRHIGDECVEDADGRANRTYRPGHDHAASRQSPQTRPTQHHTPRTQPTPSKTKMNDPVRCVSSSRDDTWSTTSTVNPRRSPPQCAVVTLRQ